MTDSRVNITQLDFDELKDSLKTFLEGEFTDYDFEGSGLSILLDELAYVAHYIGFYPNMVANEAFITSAQVRASVVSKAKELGYVPRSRVAPIATVDVTATPSPNSTAYDTKSSVVLNKGQVFTAIANGRSYEFVVTDSYTLTKNQSGEFTASGIQLTQGRFLTYEWVVDVNDNDRRFIIPNENVDTDTVRVTVQESESDSSTTVFKPADTFSDMKESNAAFWIYEAEDGRHELEFADGILGKPLKDGNIVRVEYVVTEGPVANGATGFNFTTSIQGLTDVDVTTTQKAYGGAEKESIKSIKFNAIRHFSTQNRAVTKEDYEAILIEEYPFIQSVSVWGGEENDPPQFGKVFISIKPTEGLVITTSIKEQIKRDVLSRFNIVSVLPEIVDPEFIFLELDIDITYDGVKTSQSPDYFKNLAITELENYNSTRAGLFNRDFIHSDLVCSLRDADVNITSALVTPVLRRDVSVNTGIPGNYTIQMLNALEKGTVDVSGVILNEVVSGSVTYRIQDDREGNIQATRVQTDLFGTVTETDLGTVGSVDYDNGVITLEQIDIKETVSGEEQIEVRAEPVELDVATGQNNIILIDTDNSSVEVSTQ